MGVLLVPWNVRSLCLMHVQPLKRGSFAGGGNRRSNVRFGETVFLPAPKETSGQADPSLARRRKFPPCRRHCTGCRSDAEGNGPAGVASSLKSHLGEIIWKHPAFPFSKVDARTSRIHASVRAPVLRLQSAFELIYLQQRLAPVHAVAILQDACEIFGAAAGKQDVVRSQLAPAAPQLVGYFRPFLLDPVVTHVELPLLDGWFEGRHGISPSTSGPRRRHP